MDIINLFTERSVNKLGSFWIEVIFVASGWAWGIKANPLPFIVYWPIEA
jgi:hypothetical protein